MAVIASPQTQRVAPPYLEKQMIKLELTLEEVNGVLNALGKMPYEMSFALIEKIKQQGIPQVQTNGTPVVEEDK